jgi:hypothetical protein
MAAAKTKRGKKKTSANKASSASGRFRARSERGFVQRGRGENNDEEVEGDAGSVSSGPELNEEDAEKEEDEDELSCDMEEGSDSDEDSIRDKEEASRSRRKVSDQTGDNGSRSVSSKSSLRNTSPPNSINITTPAGPASRREDAGNKEVEVGRGGSVVEPSPSNVSHHILMGPITEEKKKNMMSITTDGLMKHVRNKFFYISPFARKEEDHCVGSFLQKVCCDKAGTPARWVESFWNQEGRPHARRALNGKRKAVVNAMQIEFRSKCNLRGFERSDTYIHTCGRIQHMTDTFN